MSVSARVTCLIRDDPRCSLTEMLGLTFPVRVVFTIISSSVRMTCSLDFLDVARLPALVDRGLGRAVEPKNREIPLAGNGPEPLAYLPAGAFGQQPQFFNSHFFSSFAAVPNGPSW